MLPSRRAHPFSDEMMMQIRLPEPDIAAMAQQALRATESPVVSAFLRWALDALDHRQGLDAASQARIRRLYQATHGTDGEPTL